MHLLSPELAERLWTASWQGALVIALVWSLCRLLPLRPRVQLALWTLACIKMVTGLLTLEPIYLSVVEPNAGAAANVLSAFGWEQAAAEGVQAGTVSRAGPMVSILSVTYLLGLVTVLALGCREALRARRLVITAREVGEEPLAHLVRQIAAALGLSAPPRTLVSNGVTSPLVLGPFRPCLILPENFDEDVSEHELRMALAHELTHLRRRDLWHAAIPGLTRTVFFFFPPAWLAAKEWATSCEAACDEEAVAFTGASPSAYGELLLKIVSKGHQRQTVGSFGATTAFHSLRRRIDWMKQRSRRSYGRPVASIALLVTVIAILPWTLAAAPPSPNKFLSNASMENGRHLPSGWSTGKSIPNVRYIWDRSVAHSGKSSLCIAKSEHRYFPIAEWVQPVRYDGSQRYIEFSAWIKADNAYKAVLDVQFDFSSHQWAAFIGAQRDGDPPADHNWRLYSGTVKIPEGTRHLAVALQCYGPGTVWMDDVSVRYLNSPK